MSFTNKITVIGLGYVGLPLAVEFSKKYHVTGFDINQKRIDELKQGKDRTLEVDNSDLKAVLTSNHNSKKGLLVSNNPKDLESSNIYIITLSLIHI